MRPHLGKPADDPVNLDKRYNDDSISISHVYAYVRQLGAAYPECLIGFHIFSHSWAGGPIMVDTYQDAVYESGALRDRRDPKDKDGREKDFLSINMLDVFAFKQAFRSNAHIKIWGCLATTVYRDFINVAAQARAVGKPATEPLHFNAAGVARDMSQQDIEAKFRTDYAPRSYMTKLAKLVGIPVYGAPFGVGSNLMDIGGKSYMYVDQDKHGRALRWIKEALGMDHDDSGHLRYE